MAQDPVQIESLDQPQPSGQTSVPRVGADGNGQPPEQSDRTGPDSGELVHPDEAPDSAGAPAPSADKELDWPEDPGVPGLTDEQRQALDHLSHGASIRNTARAVGISRAKLYRLIDQHPAMRAAHNAWKRAALESGRSRLIALSDAAFDVITGKLLRENDGKLAFQLVDRLGL